MPTGDQLTSTGQGFQKGSRLPASPQTLQQAGDPEAEGALASAPSLAEGGALESLARGQGCGGRATLWCARAHVFADPLECACVHVCVPGGRREVLAASLGTYKPCGRICLRCQLKAFSNVHPTPSPGAGGGRGLGDPALLPAYQPLAQPWGRSWSLHPPVPAASPRGPETEGEGGRRHLPQRPHPPRGKAKNPVPCRLPFCNSYRNSRKMGAALAGLGDSPGIGALYLGRFSYNHSRWQEQRTDTASLPTPSPQPPAPASDPKGGR